MDVISCPKLENYKNFPEVFETQGLSSVYKALSTLDITKLSNDQIYQLKKNFFNIVIRTESYICSMTVDDKDTVSAMKCNWDDFVQKIQMDEEWINIKNEIERLWKIFDTFYCGKNQIKAKDKGKEEAVRKSIQWFHENPVELFDPEKKNKEDHINKIREALKNSNLNAFLVENIPKFIYETVEIINNFHNNHDFSKWKKKLYIYDNEGQDVCYVTFYLNDASIGTYYIDEFGNVYLKKINLLESIRKFYGYYDFKAPVQKKYDDMDERESSFTDEPETNLSAEVANLSTLDYYDDSRDNSDSECSDSVTSENSNSYGGHCETGKADDDFYVQLFYDDDFLKMILQSFKKLHKERSFLYFVNQHKNKEGKAVEYLKKLKIIFPFFSLLDCNFENIFNTSCYQEPLNTRGFKLLWWQKKPINQLVIRLKSFHFIDNNNWLLKNFDSLKDILCKVSTHNLCYNTPFMETVTYVMVADGKTPYPQLFTAYQNKTEQIFKLEKGDCVNFYHYVAAEIVDFYKAVKSSYSKKSYINLKWEEWKFLVLWVAEKFKCLEKTDLSEMIKHFEENEEDIKNEILRLIQIVAGQGHQFSSDFSAVYHFYKHYDSIRNNLQKFVDDDEFKKDFGPLISLPEYNTQNEAKCAKLYLEKLPEIIFNKNNIIESKSDDSKKVFQKYSQYSVVGIKYTFQSGKTVMSNLYMPTNDSDFESDLNIDSGFGSEMESESES